jgi:hypothetical protein
MPREGPDSAASSVATAAPRAESLRTPACVQPPKQSRGRPLRRLGFFAPASAPLEDLAMGGEVMCLPLYTSLVILHAKQAGGRESDVAADG